MGAPNGSPRYAFAMPVIACGMCLAACAHPAALQEAALHSAALHEAPLAHKFPRAKTTRQRATPQPHAPPVTLYRPRSQADAQERLDQAFSLIHQGDTPLARAAFASVLASDFLTEKGRANLYWVLAGLCHDQEDRSGEAEALGAFLVASDLLTDREEVQPRRLLARAMLAALRVQNSASLGRSPTTAIVVEDLREPATIIASMTCGDAGESHFLDVAIESTHRKAGPRLVHRRARCDADGVELDLWFDLTYAAPRRSPP